MKWHCSGAMSPAVRICSAVHNRILRNAKPMRKTEVMREIGFMHDTESNTMLVSCLAFTAIFLVMLFPSDAGCAASSSSSEVRHARAMRAEKSGDVRLAAELEGEAVRLEPGSAMFRGEHSRLLWNLGFVDKAIGECREALKLDPNNWKCRFNLAVMLQSTGDTKAAIVLYEKLLKSNPAMVQARLGLMQTFALSGRSQDAVNQIDALMSEKKLAPELMIDVADAAIKIDQPHRAKELLRDMASGTNSRALILLYLAAAKDGDDSLALSVQKKVLDTATMDPRVYLIAARLAERKGTASTQEQILDQAMKAAKNNSELYIQLAVLYMRQFEAARSAGDEKSAQAWLSLADKSLTYAEGMHAKGWTSKFAHAGVYALQGKYGLATTVINDLARKEPKNELLLYCRGQLRSYGNNPAAAAKRNLQNLFRETHEIGNSSQSSLAGRSAGDPITLACSRAHFEKLSCGCHTGVLEFKWKRLDGVLFAKVMSERPAVGIIVHQVGDLSGFKSRIISAAGTLNERIVKVETQTVKGLGALAMAVAAPEAQEEPPLSVRLNPPELQRL